MRAVRMAARAHLRARWRAWLVLTVLLGLFGGTVMAVSAGARRTGSAYSRFLTQHNAFDIAIADFSVFAPVFWQPDFDVLESLPYVVDSARVNYFVGDSNRELFGSADPRWGTEYNIQKILEGRRPRSADEVLVPFASTSLADVSVGDEVTVITSGADGEPIEHRVDVVGRSAAPGDFPPVDFVGDMFIVHPSFVTEHAGTSFNASAVMLKFARGEADMARFDADVRDLTGSKTFSPFRLTDQARAVERTFVMQATALSILAVALAIAGILVLGQAIARQVWLGADDEAALSALGMGVRARVGSHVLVGALVGAVAAVIGIGVSIAASPIFPLGIARVAEPSPGISVDLLVIVAGAGALMVGALGWTVPAAWSRARRVGRSSAHTRPSVAAAVGSSLGLRPSTLVGLRHALEPGAGASAVPVRSTLVAISLGLAALVGAFTFSESLRHLLDTPRLYGENWHHVYGFNRPPETNASAEVAASDPSVEAVALGSSGFRLTLDDLRVEGMTIDPVLGEILTTPYVAGSFPEGGQVLLGPRTSAALGVGVGDAVEVGLEGLDPVSLTVSGIAILPPIAEGSAFGEGVLLREHSLGCLALGEALGCQLTGQDVGSTDLLVRFREGVEVPAAIEALRAKLVEPDLDQDFFTVDGRDLLNFGRVDDLPSILAAILAVVALAVLTHALVTSIRRRKRDHAVLRTLGFVRSQLRASVVWQAAIVTVLAVLLAVPMGVAAGRFTWTALARGLGVVVEPRIDWGVVVIVPVAALAIAVVIALGPARGATRARPAEVLAAE